MLLAKLQLRGLPVTFPENRWQSALWRKIMSTNDSSSDDHAPPLHSIRISPSPVNQSTSYNQGRKGTEKDNNERVRLFLVGFVALLTLLGVIVCLVTRDVRMVGLIWPLLLVIRYYFPKPRLRWSVFASQKEKKAIWEKKVLCLSF